MLIVQKMAFWRLRGDFDYQIGVFIPMARAIHQPDLPS